MANEQGGNRNLPVNRGQQQQRPQENRNPPQQQKPKSSTPFNANPLFMAVEHWNRLNEIATTASKSGLLPKAINTPQAALIVALKGVEMGFSPLQAFERINVVEGKAVIDGQGMLILILQRSPETQVTWVESNESLCTVRIKNPQQVEAVTLTFTIEKAKRAGLHSKMNWQKYPEEMLRWRALAACARIAVPHLISGCYIADEMGYETDEEGAMVPAMIISQKADEAKEVIQTIETPPPSLSTAEWKTGTQLLEEVFQKAEDRGYPREEVREIIKARYPEAKTLNVTQIIDIQKLIETMPSRIVPPLAEEEKLPFEKQGSEVEKEV